MGHYKIGQVCRNGHAINSDYNGQRERRSKFCPDCGEETIHECESCSAYIRGRYHVDGVYGGPKWQPASFCHNCGKPYEWTLRQVQAAKDLADEVEGVDQEEIDRAKESFIALASDTPQSAVAAARVSKLIKKAGPVVGGAIKDIAVSIATEAVKKTMGL